MYTETVWTFRTERFAVSLMIIPDHAYRYDGDDEDGETQAKLDSGEYVAFDSVVTVTLDGQEVATDSLGGSVYGADEVAEFWTAHRDRDPMNRNCSAYRNAMRAKTGHECCISNHYFPDMVRQAIAEARQTIARLQAVPLRAA